MIYYVNINGETNVLSTLKELQQRRKLEGIKLIKSIICRVAGSEVEIVLTDAGGGSNSDEHDVGGIAVVN